MEELIVNAQQSLEEAQLIVVGTGDIDWVRDGLVINHPEDRTMLEFEKSLFRGALFHFGISSVELSRHIPVNERVIRGVQSRIRGKNKKGKQARLIPSAEVTSEWLLQVGCPHTQLLFKIFQPTP